MITDPERLFAGFGRWQRLAAAFLAGAVMTAGHPPVDLPWGGFVAVPVLVWLIAGAPSGRAAAWIGWAAGFGYFTTGLHWLGHAFLVEPDRFLFLMPLGVIGLPAFLATFWMLAFWVVKRFWPGHNVVGAVLLAAAWTAVEYARGNVLTGFPWALPGYVWVETPVMQSASWAGPYGMTLLTLILTGVPLLALASRRWVLGGATLVCIAGLWIWGTARMPAQVAYAEDAPVIRLVQPNAPQAVKWKPGYREQFYERGLQATAAPADSRLGPPDVVIWPESALYYLPANNPQEVDRISQIARRAPLIVGAMHAEMRGPEEAWTNALFTITPDGVLDQRYDKHHLVPFGEYLPIDPILRALGLRQFSHRGGFSAGPGPRTLTIDGLPPFAALICYEAIFPQEIVAGERPAWLLQLTNDAWFGSFAGPQQHLAQARIRAIEQGLPFVRSANTGISAIIDPHGLVVVSLGLHNSGGVDGKLPSPLAPTLYSRYGDWPALFLIVFSLSFSVFFRVIFSSD